MRLVLIDLKSHCQRNIKYKNVSCLLLVVICANILACYVCVRAVLGRFPVLIL